MSASGYLLLQKLGSLSFKEPSLARCFSVTSSLSKYENTHHREKWLHPSSRTQRWEMWKPKKEMWGYTTEPLPHPQTGGRGPNGRIWNFRRGGGLKKSYYMVDWYRGGPKDGEPLSERVVRIMEDKNRTAHLALVIGGERKRWIVATENMKVGDLIQSSQELTAKAVRAVEGNSYPVGSLAMGTLVNCAQMLPGEENDCRVACAAGTTAQVLRKVDDKVILKLPSKREVAVDQRCLATVGRVSNIEWDSIPWGTAGAKRRAGIRPKSGFWRRKDGRYGRKIHPTPPVAHPSAKKPKELMLRFFTD